MFRDKKAVVIPALLLVMLAGCGQEKPEERTTRLVSTKCALDVINGVNAPVVETKTGKADFRGWAVDSNSNTTPEMLNVVLTDPKGASFVFEGALRGDRPDVVKAYKQDAFLKSGFRIIADVSTLAKGTYGINLQMPSGNSVVVCRIKKVLLIN